MKYWRDIILVLAMSMVILHLSDAHSEPQDFVNAHNAARKEVGVGPITWNDTLAKFAENHANHRKGDCALKHSQGRKYGENLACGTGEFSGVDAVNMWVKEKADYDHKSHTCAKTKICGHYTQVIWKKSVCLGCARVKCNNNSSWFVTCNYDPPGNNAGEKPY